MNTHCCSCQETVQRDPDKSLCNRCVFSCAIVTNDGTMQENALTTVSMRQITGFCNTREKQSTDRSLRFFCLEFFVPLENLSFGDDTIAGEGLGILTYARHLGPLSSQGSLACQTYCDTGHPFYTGHLRGPVALIPNAERLSVELSLPVLTIQGCCAWDSNIQHSPCGANALTHCATTAAFVITRQIGEVHRQT